MSSVDHDTLIARAAETVDELIVELRAAVTERRTPETRDYAAALADAALAYRELRSSE